MLRYTRISKSRYIILIGNLIDHFDTTLYAFLAPIIGSIFFAVNNQLEALILGYIAFGISVVAKPLGAVFFSQAIRKYLPTKLLSISLLGMSFTTFVIAFVPSYEEIGLLSSCIIIFLRFFSGICSIGEVTISKILLLQREKPEDSIKNSSLHELSTMGGVLLASIISTAVYKSDHEYTWRIVFIISGIAGFVVSSIRYYPHFYYHKNYHSKDFAINKYNISWYKILYKYKKTFLILVLIYSFSNITYYVPFVLINGLIPTVYPEISFQEMMHYNTIFVIVDIFLLLMCIRILPKIKIITKQVMLVSIILISFVSPLLLTNFLYMDVMTATNILKFFIIFVGVFFASVMNVWALEIVSNNKNQSYLLIRMSSSIASVFTGKLLPFFLMFLYQQSLNILIIPLFISILSLIIFFILLNYKNEHI